jgi:hypothetical protein
MLPDEIIAQLENYIRLLKELKKLRRENAYLEKTLDGAIESLNRRDDLEITMRKLRERNEYLEKKIATP